MCHCAGKIKPIISRKTKNEPGSDTGTYATRVAAGGANWIGNGPRLADHAPRRTMRMSMMAETSSLERRVPAERPLSPHLQIYRPMLTMMMSIVHRITGFANYFGTLLLAWWLIAAPRARTAMPSFNGSRVRSIGRLILFGYTWA